MNAPHFAPATNGPATPAADSPFNFLTAGSTNPATPDFKTIAASFFAVPTTTAAGPTIETKSTTDAKSVGPFTPRERQNNKKDAQGSELPATFLPAIPVYPFPALTPQATKHAEPMSELQATQTKTDSSASIRTLPVEDQSQDLVKTLTAQPTTALPGKVSQQDAKASDVESTLPATPSVELSEASADAEGETTSVGKAAVSVQLTTSERSKLDKAQPQVDIDTRRNSAASFTEKLSSRIDKPAGNENKKLAQTKQSIETAKDTSTDNTSTSSAVEPDQTQQAVPAPQNIDDAIKAVIPQAVVLEHSVSASALAHSTDPNSTHAVKSATKNNQQEPSALDANTATSALTDKASTDVLNAAKPIQAPELNSKASNGKSKADITTKKAQKTNPENQSDATPTFTTSHRPETNAVSSSQSAASKNHDMVTPQLGTMPHAKSASAKNISASSDLTSPSATQVPDIDDVTPPSHTGVNTAKLVQGLTQSELRVGFQTREFGNIDIRTSASRHEFSAQISVEHSEVAHTLTSELPNLYARLNEQQVPVSNIHIHNQSLSTSSGLDQRSQQSAQQPQSNGFTKQHTETTLPSVHEVFSSTDRLDIRV